MIPFRSRTYGIPKVAVYLKFKFMPSYLLINHSIEIRAVKVRNNP